MQRRWAVGLAVALGMAPAWAINKCTLADGSVVYQDALCSVAAKSAAPVKTWENTPGSYSRGAATARRVDPNEKLTGPPQSAALVGIYRRWIDAEKLALSTPRIALAGPIATMQALARDAEGVRVPACMADAKAALGSITAKSASALLSFMGDKNDIVGMVYQLVDREKLLTDFERGVTTARCDGT